MFKKVSILERLQKEEIRNIELTNRIEQLESDIAYLAMMLDVELESTKEEDLNVE